MSAVPDRVVVETNAHLEQQAQNEQFAAEFDPWCDDLMRDLFGKTLAEPLSNFLIAWAQVEKTEQSFGADKEKSFDFLRPHLANLKTACLKVFEEDQ